MKTNKFRRSFLSVLTMMLVASLVLPSYALAQTANTGVITGVVKDEKGAVVPNATVRAVNVGTNAPREVTTSGDGGYEITQLAPGTYRVEVEAQGFAKQIQDQVTVNVLARTTVDPQLRPGGASEVVNVSSENAPLIETTKVVAQ